MKVCEEALCEPVSCQMVFFFSVTNSCEKTSVLKYVLHKLCLDIIWQNSLFNLKCTLNKVYCDETPLFNSGDILGENKSVLTFTSAVRICTHLYV